MRRALAGFLVIAAAAGAARADEVETADGRKIVGKVLSQDGGVVKIKTKFGVIEVPLAEVKRITPGPTPEEAFDTKKKAAKSGEDFFQLARWCGDQGMRKEAREALELAVAADPAHEGAHRALGHVKDGEDWVTLDEKRAREAARERAALEAQGLVEYQGRWVTREERDALEKGLVKVGDRWLPVEEANRAKGLELWEGKWIPVMDAFAEASTRRFEKEVGGPPWARKLGKHVAACGPYDAKGVERVAEAGDRAFAYLDGLFGGDGDGSAANRGIATVEWWKPDLPAPLVAASRKRAPLVELMLFSEDAEYEKGIDLAYAESRLELAETWPAAAKRSFGGFVFHPIGRSLVVARGRDPESVAGHAVHNLAHVVAHRHVDTPTFLPPWYDEALALLAEDAATGALTMFCSVKAVSGTRAEDPKGPKGLVREWRARLREALRAGRCQSLRFLTEHDLFDLTVEDLLKGASVLEWLGSRRDGSLERLHAHLQKGYGYDRVSARSREIHDAAFRAAVKLDGRGAESAWESWFSKEPVKR